MSANGKVALVTGANRGLGRETARQLARDHGMTVVLTARDEDKARTAADELSKEGGTFVPKALDVSEPGAAERVVAEVEDELGRLDVLVNNAGIGADFGVSGLQPDFAKIQEALDTNFYGAYRMAVAALPLMRRGGSGRIVNVSSGMGGITEMGGWTPGYRVSKAALNAVTRILSAELAGEGILVNSACPGFVATDMGGPMGAKKSVEDGAAGIVWLATLPDDGPRGGFFRDGKPIAF